MLFEVSFRDLRLPFILAPCPVRGTSKEQIDVIDPYDRYDVVNRAAFIISTSHRRYQQNRQNEPRPP